MFNVVTFNKEVSLATRLAVSLPEIPTCSRILIIVMNIPCTQQILQRIVQSCTMRYQNN